MGVWEKNASSRNRYEAETGFWSDLRGPGPFWEIISLGSGRKLFVVQGLKREFREKNRDGDPSQWLLGYRNAAVVSNCDALSNA
jgi:hypothetical protein